MSYCSFSDAIATLVNLSEQGMFPTEYKATVVTPLLKNMASNQPALLNVTSFPTLITFSKS